MHSDYSIARVFLDLIEDRSYFTIFYHKAALLLFCLIEAYLIHLPFSDIKLFIMIIDSNELLYWPKIMRNVLFRASVTIWKIRPTGLRSVRFVIYHKVISKARTVLSMHSNCELAFKRGKFKALVILVQRKDKCLISWIFVILPFRRRSPRDSTKSTHNVTILCSGNYESISFSITNFMKISSRKLVLRGSIK